MVSFSDALAQIEGTIVRSLDTGRRFTMVIDGHAGSGKTLLANEVRDAVFRAERIAPRLIHMDDLYPGWEGLQAGSQYLLQNILNPLQKGRSASWQKWDWVSGVRGDQTEPGNGWREFDGSAPLIIEGCGSLSRQTAKLVDLAIWLDSEREERLSRLKNRDGGQFDEFWPIWAIQEEEFYQAERSRELADLVVSN